MDQQITQSQKNDRRSLRRWMNPRRRFGAAVLGAAAMIAMLFAVPAQAAETAVPDSETIAQRVAETKERLSATEGGKLVWAAMEAHGGLQRWYENGPIRFRFRFAPQAEGRAATDTVQIVDTWSARAVHFLAEDSSKSFGWDGSEAWVRPAGAELPVNARFWSLTPYYFVAMPFVLGDPGVRHETEGSLELEGRTYDLVRITFDSGTGDAPDDYYVLLVDREDHSVGGVRYVVSYPGFFPEGGHTPENLLVFDGAQTVDGIILPHGSRGFPWQEQGPGDTVSVKNTLSEVSFHPGTPDAAFHRPSDSSVQEGL
ncbi:MAG: hypothetical protein AAGD01_17125 [Acidobacteriota bacterium]